MVKGNAQSSNSKKLMVITGTKEGSHTWNLLNNLHTSAKTTTSSLLRAFPHDPRSKDAPRNHRHDRAPNNDASGAAEVAINLEVVRVLDPLYVRSFFVLQERSQEEHRCSDVTVDFVKTAGSVSCEGQIVTSSDGTLGIFPYDIIRIPPRSFLHRLFRVAQLEFCSAHPFQSFFWGLQGYVERIVWSFVREHGSTCANLVFVAGHSVAGEDDLIIFNA